MMQWWCAACVQAPHAAAATLEASAAFVSLACFNLPRLDSEVLFGTLSVLYRATLDYNIRRQGVDRRPNL